MIFLSSIPVSMTNGYRWTKRKIATMPNHKTQKIFEIKLILAMLLASGLAIVTCQKTTEAISGVIPDEPYERLSQYQFFTGLLSDLNPADRVIPYDLNTPLFSDYAYKARFVWMPEGSSANYTTGDVLDFPEHAVLIKNFYYLNDERQPIEGRRIIETRLLINRGAEWEALTYIWNDDQSDAFLEVVGGIKQVSWLDKQGLVKNINYIIPNKNQCKSCHLSGKKQIPIGPKVRNLNKSFKYADGPMNQLVKWDSMGYLKGYNHSQEHPKAASWNDVTTGNLHQRAMAYLDINCGHCHNPKGSANTSGLNLVADTKPGRSLGIYKPTVSAGAGTGGHTYSIVPGNANESVLVYRMSSTDPGAMMPELGRSVVHQEGVELISEWIEKMETDSMQVQSSILQ